jgi:very-short-patch-repair endonuclease
MVGVNLNKRDLVPGFSGPSNLFRKMGLNLGQTFTNKHGTKLIVEYANFSDKWYVQPLEDTGLEEDTEAILSDIGIDSQHYEKQFHLDGTSKNYRIDFALPSIRLAIEPHEQEKEKEADLNEMGWDVLWLDDDDLAAREQATAKIKSTIHQVASNIEIQRNDNSLTLHKTPLDYNSQFSYKLEEDSTVVYQGEVVPRGVAMLKQQTRDANR